MSQKNGIVEPRIDEQQFLPGQVAYHGHIMRIVEWRVECALESWELGSHILVLVQVENVAHYGVQVRVLPENGSDVRVGRCLLVDHLLPIVSEHRRIDFGLPRHDIGQTVIVQLIEHEKRATKGRVGRSRFALFALLFRVAVISEFDGVVAHPHQLYGLRHEVLLA